MSYSITQLLVDTDGKVFQANWSYATEDGVYTDRHYFFKPYGEAALATVTEEIALTWLESQLSPDYSPERLEQAITNRKQRNEYRNGLTPYEVHPSAAPTKVGEEQPATMPSDPVLPGKTKKGK